MGQYVQAAELGQYFPASRVIDLAGGDSEAETMSSLAPETEATLEERIANAEAEAHGYLQGRFALPINPVPERLRLAVGKMTVYYLYEDKPELWGSSGANPAQDQYDIHREWLEGVKDSELFVGSAELPGTSGVLGSTDGPAGRFAGGGVSDFG